MSKEFTEEQVAIMRAVIEEGKAAVTKIHGENSEITIATRAEFDAALRMIDNAEARTKRFYEADGVGESKH